MTKINKWWAKFTGKHIGPDGQVYTSLAAYQDHCILQMRQQLLGRNLQLEQLLEENKRLRNENAKLNKKGKK